VDQRSGLKFFMNRHVSCAGNRLPRASSPAEFTADQQARRWTSSSSVLARRSGRQDFVARDLLCSSFPDIRSSQTPTSPVRRDPDRWCPGEIGPIASVGTMMDRQMQAGRPWSGRPRLLSDGDLGTNPPEFVLPDLKLRGRGAIARAQKIRKKEPGAVFFFSRARHRPCERWRIEQAEGRVEIGKLFGRSQKSNMKSLRPPSSPGGRWLGAGRSGEKLLQCAFNAKHRAGKTLNRIASPARQGLRRQAARFGGGRRKKIKNAASGPEGGTLGCVQHQVTARAE